MNILKLYKFCTQPTKQTVKKTLLSKVRQEVIQNAIVNAQKEQKIRPKEHYRANILFEEILNREVDVLLYHTHSRPFFFLSAFVIGGFALSSFGLWLILQNEKFYKRDFELFKFFVTLGFMGTLIKRYRRFYKYQVESMNYNTLKKEITLIKRNVIWMKKKEVLKPDKLLFTQDETLNAKTINYINIETMECYAIGYEYAWRNKELFSHLLSQNIQ